MATFILIDSREIFVVLETSHQNQI